MTNPKRPKWDISNVIESGSDAYSLAIKHKDDLSGRIPDEELTELQTNVINLKSTQSGGSETLINQKSKTLLKKGSIEELNDFTSGIRKIVRDNKKVTPEIAKAYGVGEILAPTTDKAVAAAKVAINAYTNFKDWSNSAGIIDADIEQLKTLIANIDISSKAKKDATNARKDNTFDKYTVQREIEDEVTRISDIGIFVFKKKNPAIAELFAKLIPSSNGGNNGSENTNPTDNTIKQ